MEAPTKSPDLVARGFTLIVTELMIKFNGRMTGVFHLTLPLHLFIMGMSSMWNTIPSRRSFGFKALVVSALSVGVYVIYVGCVTVFSLESEAGVVVFETLYFIVYLTVAVCYFWKKKVLERQTNEVF